MTNLTKRLAALLMAMVLSLAGLGALAEAAPMMPVTPQDVFARGGSIKTDLSLNLDAQALGSLMFLFTGEADEASKSVTDTVLGAINKLKISTHATAKLSQLSIGTEKGELANLFAHVDTDKGELAVVTSLLPGLKLNPPENVLKALLDSQQQMTQQTVQMAALAMPYGEALTGYFTEQIVPKAEVMATPVEIASVGSFDNEVKFVVDNQMLAGLINALLDVFKQDENAKKLLDDYLKAASAQQAALGSGETEANDAPKSSADMVGQIEAMVKTLTEDPGRKLANVSVFTSSATGETYVTTEAMGDEGKPEAMVTTLVSAKDGGSQIKVEVIAGQPTTEDAGMMAAEEAGEEAAAEEAAEAMPTEEAKEAMAAPAMVDWQALKAGVLDGTNMETTVVSLTLNNATDTAGNQMLSDLALNLNTSGMSAGIQASGKNQLTGKYAAEGTLSLSVMSPSPLLTVSFSSMEAEDLPQMPDTEGLKSVALTEEMGEAETAPLAESLKTQGLPKLLENMKTALPEESALLVPMIQQALTPAEEVQAN